MIIKHCPDGLQVPRKSSSFELCYALGELQLGCKDQERRKNSRRSNICNEVQQYSYSYWLPKRAGNKTLGDSEILLHCVLTMTKVREIETPVGSARLCGKYCQMKEKQNLRSLVRGAQALGQRLQRAQPKWGWMDSLESKDPTEGQSLFQPEAHLSWILEISGWRGHLCPTASFLCSTIIPVSPLGCNSRWGFMCMTRQVLCYWAHSHKTFIVLLFWFHLQQRYSAGKALFLLSVRKQVLNRV